jgi:hypothetical protein
VGNRPQDANASSDQYIYTPKLVFCAAGCNPDRPPQSLHPGEPGVIRLKGRATAVDGPPAGITYTQGVPQHWRGLVAGAMHPGRTATTEGHLLSERQHTATSGGYRVATA